MFQSEQIIKPQTQTKTNKHKSTPQIMIDFFPSLIKLEEAFHLKILDKDNINSLVLKYAKLVEYYDFIKDPIKNYFLEKMQFVLSRPESIKTMVDVSENKMDKVKLMQAFSNFQNLSRAPSIMDLVEQKNVLKNLDGQINPNQRGQQVNLNLEIQKQKMERKGSLDRIINDFETEQQKMDQFFQEEMRIQGEYFQQKLHKRQRKLQGERNIDNICKTQEDERIISII